MIVLSTVVNSVLSGEGDQNVSESTETDGKGNTWLEKHVDKMHMFLHDCCWVSPLYSLL